MYYTSRKLKDAVREYAVCSQSEFITVYSRACHALDLIRIAEIQPKGDRWIIVRGNRGVRGPRDYEGLCDWAKRRAGLILLSQFEALDEVLMKAARDRLMTKEPS